MMGRSVMMMRRSVMMMWRESGMNWSDRVHGMLIRMEGWTDLNMWWCSVIGQDNVEDLHPAVEVQKLCRLQSQAIPEGGKEDAIDANDKLISTSVDRQSEMLARMNWHSSVTFLSTP